MEKIPEIKAAVTSFQNDTAFLNLRTRWQTDYDLFRLKPYAAGKGYYSYTSNSPRVLADKLISMLVDSHLLIKFPDETLDEKEQATANNIERFLYGCYTINDEKKLYMPDTPSLRDMKAWNAVVRGGFAGRVYVYKNEDGETIPDIAIWDLYNTSYGLDNKGIAWAAYSYKIPASQAKAEYKTQAMLGEVEVIDFWDREKYCTIVQDKFGQDFVKHGLGYCPVFIHRAGSTPVVWQKNYQYSASHAGESAFAGNRQIYNTLNKTLSDVVTLVRRGVKVPMGHWTFDGTSNIEEDIFQVEKAGIVPMRVGEELKPIMTQTTPIDTTPLLNWVSGEVQRGGISHTALGELGFRLSGFAITQLQGALSTVVSPFALCLERSYLVECLEFIKQYSKGKFPPVKVRGRTSKNEVFGYPKSVEIKPSDVKGDWHPEVSLEPVFPKDDAQRYQLARLAREGEIPLLADKTIRSDILGVQDADLEDLMVDRQWADKLVISRLYDAYLKAIDDSRPDKAMNYIAELRRLMAGSGQQGGGNAPAGIPTSVLPPEAMGNVPPGAANARMEPTTEREL